ncbi:MAG: 4Fe-4S dicluster domain-containing protein [Candidatus Wallbacteria bacterium]|nr:4Fe-4S dicluster domain-containing protein [Candidatus Wallbacteria bacterium]
MDKTRPIGRSALLRQGLSQLLGKLVEGLEQVEEQVAPRRFRPPGALAEPEFLATCQRCNACVRACEPGILMVLQPGYGIASGTPHLEPHSGPCQMCPELPCIGACPSGALRPIPLEQVRIGIARLDPARCIAFHGQDCHVCLDVCPLPGKAIAIEAGRPAILDARCTGCGVCSFACVAQPTAIRIEKL